MPHTVSRFLITLMAGLTAPKRDETLRHCGHFDTCHFPLSLDGVRMSVVREGETSPWQSAASRIAPVRSDLEASSSSKRAHRANLILVGLAPSQGLTLFSSTSSRKLRCGVSWDGNANMASETLSQLAFLSSTNGASPSSTNTSSGRVVLWQSDDARPRFPKE